MTQELSIPSAAAAAAVTAVSGLIMLLHYICVRSKSRQASLTTVQESKDGCSNPSSNDRCIYLDYNGTTPIYPEVLHAMLPYLSTHYGNASSSHFYGRAPREGMSRARHALLHLLGKTDERSLVFTGCGTEANNLAIYLAIRSTPVFTTEKKHVVTSNVEHPAISECLDSLEQRGEISVTYVPVNEQGIVSADEMILAIRPETILVTLMLANNESGALQPVRAVSSECCQRGILFHTDAAQAVGKISLQNAIDQVDMVTIVGHKFGAPKGVAALYIRPNSLQESDRKEPNFHAGALLLGGSQEGGRRAGTENVPYIVGMGRAAELSMAHDDDGGEETWIKNARRMEHLRARLLRKLIDGLGDETVRPNGPLDPKERLPNTLSVGLKHVQGSELLTTIQDKVACSAGSACHASGGKVSTVLMAMNVPNEFAVGTLRLSVGPTTTEEDVDRAGDIIVLEARRQLGMTTTNK